MKMFDLFAEAIEDLYTGIIDCICEEDTSSLGRICDEEGGWQLVFG